MAIEYFGKRRKLLRILKRVKKESSNQGLVSDFQVEKKKKFGLSEGKSIVVFR